MNRSEILAEIRALAGEAIVRGFDWPTEANAEHETTETLADFLEEVKQFLWEEDNFIP